MFEGIAKPLTCNRKVGAPPDRYALRPPIISVRHPIALVVPNMLCASHCLCTPPDRSGVPTMLCASHYLRTPPNGSDRSGCRVISHDVRSIAQLGSWRLLDGRGWPSAFTGLSPLHGWLPGAEPWVWYRICRHSSLSGGINSRSLIKIHPLITTQLPLVT